MTDRPTTSGGAGRPTTAANSQRGYRPTTGTHSGAAGTGPQGGWQPLHRPYTEGSQFYDEREEYEEEYEDDGDEGMFSFMPPAQEDGDRSPAPSPSLDRRQAADLQREALRQQQALVQAQHDSQYGSSHSPSHYSPSYPPFQHYVPQASTSTAPPPPALSVPTQPAPPSGGSSMLTPEMMQLSPAAAIAARYHRHNPRSPPQTAVGSQSDASGAARRRRLSGTTATGGGQSQTMSEKAYSTSRSQVHDLGGDLRSGVLVGPGMLGSRTSKTAHSIGSGSSHSLHKVADESGGYRVAAGGVGAHLQQRRRGSAATGGDIEANGDLGLRELGKIDRAFTEEESVSGSPGAEHEDAKSFRGASHGVSPMDAYQLEDFALDEEDSPYPEVRASVSNIDDPEMPTLTFRAWLLGLFFSIVCGGLNIFFTLRYPAPLITPLVIQIVAYPVGKLLARVMPDRVFTVPGGPVAHSKGGFMGLCNRWWPRWLGAGKEWSFNPGPFNIKEHCLVNIMANAAVGPIYAVNISLVMDKYYLDPTPISFDFLLALSSQLIGFALAGITRRFLIWPASMIWPNNLVICTLLNTFHAEDDDGSDGSVTRYRFFCYILSGAFIWYWVPGFLFRALSFFSWICWMAPNNRVVNQLFGVSSGLGMGLLTFDWSQIAYNGSPLVVPWWAEVNGFTGFVFFFWILGPIIYYTNAWLQAYLPLFGTGVFDRYGQPYDTTSVVDIPTKSLNVTAYEAYSPLYIPMTFTSVYSVAFALSSAVIIHTLLYHGHSIIDKIKNIKTEDEDVHAKLMRNYPEVPDWWYWVYLVIFITLSIITVEVYGTGLPVWGLFLAIAISAVYIIPGGFIYAMTSQQLTINIVAEVVPGYLLPGKPYANMLFKVYSVQSLLSGLNFAQDLKLGHYMKIPPRTTFVCQIVATLSSALVQVGVKALVASAVPDLCSSTQPSGLVCPTAHTFYSASVIWGLLGPARQFGVHTLYRPIVYWALIGIFLPVPFYLLTRRFPNTWVKYINIPVLLVGATFAPPANGINYASWMLVGFIFQYWLRRNRFRWWSKFNFVLSGGLETGTVLGTIMVFLTLQLPKADVGGVALNWWGNTVFQNTDDWNGVPYRDPPPEGFGPTSW